MNSEVYFTLHPTRQPQNLIDGLLYISPLPSDDHEETVLAVAEALAAFARARGGKVLVGPDCWLDHATVVQPDVAYLASARALLAGGYVRGARDLAVEVVTPGSRAFDTEAKFNAYGKSGVREAWFVDPGTGTVTITNGDGSEWGSECQILMGDEIPSEVVPGIGSAGLKRE